jgi:hypothetical protein
VAYSVDVTEYRTGGYRTATVPLETLAPIKETLLVSALSNLFAIVWTGFCHGHIIRKEPTTPERLLPSGK